MSDYGNPPRDPQQPDPYGQGPYGQTPYPQHAYGQGPYGREPGYGSAYGGPSDGYASWIKRVGGTLIDALLSLLSLIPLYIGLGLIASTSTTTTLPDGTSSVDVQGSAPGTALLVVGALIAAAFFIWNTFVRQGRTGATLGKSAMGIALIKESTGQPVGAGMAFVRYIVHQFTDGLCFLGYLWPLWDSKRQTWTDKILSQVVVNRPKG